MDHFYHNHQVRVTEWQTDKSFHILVLVRFQGVLTPSPLVDCFHNLFLTLFKLRVIGDNVTPSLIREFDEIPVTDQYLRGHSFSASRFLPSTSRSYAFRSLSLSLLSVSNRQASSATRRPALVTR